MHGTYFYFASLRKLTAAFGNMFNELQIQRLNEDDTVNKIINVPLAYGPRRGFLVKLREDIARSEGPNIAITLPRMSFEMVSLAYDADRQTNPLGKQSKAHTTDSDLMRMQFAPVPLQVQFDLSIYSQNIDDSLQIMEQILPYFAPSVNLTLNEIAELGMKKDVQVTMDAPSLNVDDEGIIGDGRTIIWSLPFTCTAYCWPPISDQGVIKTTISNLYNDTSSPENLDAIITVYVDPITAKISDAWVATEEIVEDNG
jgi:hypothetical protein